MQIAQSKTRDQYPLSPKKIIKKTVTGSIGWMIIFAIFATAIFSSLLTVLEKFNLNFMNIFIWVIIIILSDILITILNYFYQRWYFAVYFYDLTEDHIIIKKGPIAPSEITIPYERIQDVYVDQDLFDRMFGLYDVHISSATFMSGIQAHIDGVEKPAADGLKTLMLQKMHEKINLSKNGNNLTSSPNSSQV